MTGDDRAAAGERLLLALLAAVVLGYWALQYHPFLLPNNDYPSFERAARSLAAGELPQSFQRMPVFPAAMAALAPALPGRHAHLHAALLLNLAFALGTLVLLHGLAASVLGRGAIVLAVTFAAATQLHTAALQPLVEPSLCFFVVLAFVLFRARSPWQWAAVFGAALSRYEAALLVPVLFLANGAADGRWVRHGVRGALAASGALAWTLLGALRGSGGSTYLDLMSGMAFTPAFDFLERSFKEPFRGWYRTPFGPGFWVFLAVVGGGLALGLREGWRRYRLDAAALAGFWLAAAATIVAFGINKARYVYPTEWIPLLFFVGGLLFGLARLESVLARQPRGRAAGAALTAALLLGATAWRWWPRLAGEPSPVPLALDVAFGLALLALAAWGLWRAAPAHGAGQARSVGPARLAAALAGLVVLLPLVGGGLQAKRAELWKIHHANYGSVVAARWLEQHLPEGERAVLLPVSHVLHLTDLASDRLVFYGQLDAENLEELRSEMRARGASWALYTWRKPLQTPSDAYYDRKLKAYLSRAFQGGGPVEGFEHVATLPLPEALGRDPVHVYRLLPEDGA